MTSRTEPTVDPTTRTARPWVVILYNDDVHSFDQVVLQVQKATGKSVEEAYKVTLEAHRRGKSVAHTAELSECQRVANVLRQIRLQVEVDET